MADCNCDKACFGIPLVRMDYTGNGAGSSSGLEDLLIVEGIIELKRVGKSPGFSHHKFIPANGETNLIDDGGNFATPFSGIYLITVFPGLLSPGNAFGLHITRSTAPLVSCERDKTILRSFVTTSASSASVSGSVLLREDDIISVWCDSDLGTASLIGGSNFSICCLSKTDY